MNGIALTKSVRYGNNEASFYVDERVEIVRKGNNFALVIYANNHGEFACAGLHTVAGCWTGGDASEWEPVTEIEGVEHVVREWQSFGWELVA